MNLRKNVRARFVEATGSEEREARKIRICLAAAVVKRERNSKPSCDGLRTI